MIKKATRENVVPGVFFVTSDSCDSCQFSLPFQVTRTEGDWVYCKAFGKNRDGEIVKISDIGSSEYIQYIRLVFDNPEEAIKFREKALRSAQETEDKCRQLWRDSFEKLYSDEGITEGFTDSERVKGERRLEIR